MKASVEKQGVHVGSSATWQVWTPAQLADDIAKGGEDRVAVCGLGNPYNPSWGAGANELWDEISVYRADRALDGLYPMEIGGGYVASTYCQALDASSCSQGTRDAISQLTGIPESN